MTMSTYTPTYNDSPRKNLFPVLIMGILIFLALFAFATMTQTTTSVAEVVAEDLFLEAHSDPSHNPTSEVAQARIATLTTSWTVAASNGGMDPEKWRCAVIKMANGVTRWSIWMAESSVETGGILAWYETTGWGGVYPKPLNNFLRGQPNGSASKEFVDCNDLTPPGPLQFIH